jgi:hypothetical protein
MANVHEDMDSFWDAVYDDEVVIRDAERRIWLAWETENGNWYAVRPRSEDDPERYGDPCRPVGPFPVENLSFPLHCVVAYKALDGGDS